ncbi:nucleotide-binding protein [Methylocapsa sp. D3K7]|uniref:nucleotide-binding protein n=1 Tax=Methylocapsa sp. D3K7 TaxID=3041435 RepID=UPI00244EDED9|nr:nucleotide-binding protein [Methylocapsa sp. D3K7]WGJ13485.1 nucleotide-binding protein [Methylocapsa sp. D3K7]
MTSRRPVLPKPEIPILTVDQKRRRIERLQNCIRDLGAFDPQKVQKRYGVPEVMALEVAIADALSAAFGDRTPAYERYSRAATLDHGPHIARMPPVWGGGSINYDARDADEARHYFADGKQQSVVLLHQAIRTLEDEIAEQEYETSSSPPTHVVAQAPLSRKVFVVHGHEEGPREALARFLEKIDFTPIILHEQANQGRTIIEKFEDHADVGFAVVLLTPDDMGSPRDGTQQPRARQNVVLELGYFIGKLGRRHVCAIKSGELEMPSDIIGVAWTPFDNSGAWRTALAKELEAAGNEIDWNKAMRS